MAKSDILVKKRRFGGKKAGMKWTPAVVSDVSKAQKTLPGRDGPGGDCVGVRGG